MSYSKDLRTTARRRGSVETEEGFLIGVEADFGRLGDWGPLGVHVEASKTHLVDANVHGWTGQRLGTDDERIVMGSNKRWRLPAHGVQKQVRGLSVMGVPWF